MTIKLVATDMDGTFLNDKKNFDKKRFQRIYDYMIQHQIQFVTASGNQYYQLKNFFKDFPQTLFVAENGALIGGHEEIYRTDSFSKTMILKIIKVLGSLSNIQVVVCGKKSAYLSDQVPNDFYKLTSFYFPKVKTVQSLSNINDDILKFSVNCPNDQTKIYMDKLAKLIGPNVSIVSSGHGDIDIIRTDTNKATALQFLSKKFNISSEQMCAFGDGGNDLEMLNYVGHSVAMSNGTNEVLQVAKYKTNDNNDQGVLNHLERIFNLI